MTEHIYAPVDGWLVWLLEWRLPFVVEPMPGHHGYWSIMLWRPL